MFCLLLHPLLWGKMHLQWDARFWWGFSVWDWFWVCFLTRKMHSSKFQWEKVRWKKDVALGVARRSICRGPYVCGRALFSFLRLIWRNCWPYWDVFLWERSRAELAWKPRAGVLVARLQQVNLQLAASQPQVRDCPSAHSSIMPLLQRRVNRRVTSRNCCVRAWGLDSHSQRFVVV